MKRISIQTIVYLALLVGTCSAYAQNPLRQFGDSQSPRNANRENESTAYGLINRPAIDHATSSSGSGHNQRTLDGNVQPALFQQPAGDDSGGEKNGNLQPLMTTSSPDALPGNQKLADIVSKISINLVFVLCFALGMLLLAKKFLKPSSATNSSSTTDQANTLQIRQTLKIDNKNSIRIVQWRTNRFLVACDQTGIQSVHPLNSSFGQTLDEMDDQKLDARAIKTLLEDMDSRAA